MSFRFSTFACLLIGMALLVTALPTRAEDLRAAGEQEAKRWQDAYNSKDAATIAGMYTEDAVYSSFAWTAAGRQAIQQGLQAELAQGIGRDLKIVVERAQDLGGNRAAFYGSWTGSLMQPPPAQTSGASAVDAKWLPVQGRWLAVAERRGDRWQIVSHVGNIAPPTRK
jgi:uncharacterized protein (TIGR02246 family)